MMASRSGMADLALRRWVGAGTLPGRLGDWEATVPLVVLEIAGSRLTLRLRPKFLAKLTGVDPLAAEASGKIEILPVRPSWRLPGIEFRVPGRASYYFRARNRDEILSQLAGAGFKISSAPGPG
jgi:hypothetical protein